MSMKREVFMESMEGLECYVIQMRFKGHGMSEDPFKPQFLKTFRGQDVHNGQIVTGDITQAYRFSTPGDALWAVRRLLSNPAVCNDTPNSYEVYIRKLLCGVARRVRLADDGHSISFYD